MDRNDVEWKLENGWLQEVLKEVQKQYNEKRDFKEKFKKDGIQTREFDTW